MNQHADQTVVLTHFPRRGDNPSGRLKTFYRVPWRVERQDIQGAGHAFQGIKLHTGIVLLCGKLEQRGEVTLCFLATIQIDIEPASIRQQST